jgi:glycosyltransferase involved in cell wall biosynthesis
MTNEPLVTVIMPCYNYGSYIAESISSLQNQSFKDWECLIIDDGSTDNTANQIKKIQIKDQRIIYKFQKNGGPSKARNLGLDTAKGQFVQFLDADDFIQSDKFSQVKSYLDSFPDTDLVYGEGRVFKENNIKELYLNHPGQKQKNRLLNDLNGKQLIKALCEENPLFINMPLVKTSLARQIRFDENLPRNEDWDFWMRIALTAVSFSLLPKGSSNLSLVRIHNDSLITDELKMDEALVQMRKKWNDLLQSSEIRELNCQKLQLAEMILGIKLKIKKENRQGNSYLRKSLKRGKSLKLSFFGLLSLILPGNQAMKLLKKITGQVS